MNTPILHIDAETFANQFPAQPFVITHDLGSHPLFEMSRLIELSKRMPAASVEWNAGNIPVSVDPANTPQNGLSPEETIRRIAECRSWLVLKNVEQDLEYKRLLDECLNVVQRFSESIVPGMQQREGFIFITSPNSVTPYHTDPEHNFLLQVRGSKSVYMFDGSDRSILSEEELEGFHGGGHRNLRFRDEYQAKAEEFVLRPGMGLHFPVNDPHWVKNGDDVSVSFSITFRSPASKRNARLYDLNSRLRKVGLAPSPVGESPWRDTVKDATFRVCMKAARTIGVKSFASPQAVKGY